MDTISILLVDDNPTFLSIATQFLKRCEGLTVVDAARDGEQAIARTQAVQPDVVLIDFHMADLASSAVIPRLRVVRPGVHIIAVTVPDVQSRRRSSLTFGVDAFVSRSSLRTELVPTIWRVVERKPHAATGTEAPLVAGGRTSSRRILVMEDEHYLRRFYSRALRRAGYDVLAAATIAEARHLLDRHRFDAFLCDIHMGTERGTDLLQDEMELLREKGTYIVLVSAESQYRQLCEEMGTDFFIMKPVSVGPLVTLMDRLTGDGRVSRAAFTGQAGV